MKKIARPLMRQGWKLLLMAMVVTLSASGCSKDDNNIDVPGQGLIQRDTIRKENSMVVKGKIIDI